MVENSEKQKLGVFEKNLPSLREFAFPTIFNASNSKEWLKTKKK